MCLNADNSPQHQVWLSVGSNSPDSTSRVAAAMGFLADLLSQPRAATSYFTPALNGRDPDYLNTVVTGAFSGSRQHLCALCKEHERSAGRTPQSKSAGCVPIDIDLVIWDDTVLRPDDFGRQYFVRGYRELNDESLR